MPPALFLASASPRRQDLLRQVGIDFTLLAPGADEDGEALEAVLPGEAPADYVLRVTRLKAEAAGQRLRRRHPEVAPDATWLLCADTTVALDGAIFGKPADAADAARILRSLSGSTHDVLTAVCVRRGGALFEAVQSSQVRFAELTAEDIAEYVATGEPMGKAGAYAIQGWAAAFIEHVSGSPSGIIGLPLFETLHLLRAAGWRRPALHSALTRSSVP